MNILVAIDFSDPTEKILRVAHQLAHSLEGSVWLVHVAEPEPDFVGYEAGPDVVRDQVAKKFRKEHRVMQEYAEAMREQGIDAKAMLIQGATVETLLEMATKQQSDLIVVGSHGRGMVAEILLGSVSRGLIKSAACPVTVVPVNH